MPASERRAVVTLIALAVAGHAIRYVANDPGAAPGTVLLPPADRAALVAHRDRVAEALRPLAEGERIDLNRAGVPELTRLPRIGPALAKAIVADRERRGPFADLGDLARVSGVGPVLLETVGPHAEFTGIRPMPGPVVSAGDPAPSSVNLNQAGVQELQQLPGIGPTRAASLVAFRELHGPFASLAALAAVPGIGPKLIARLEGLAHVR